MREETEEEKSDPLTPCRYSFRRKTKMFRNILCAAAAVMAFLIVGMNVSARFRSWVTGWKWTTHKEYSEFTPESDSEDLSVEEASSYYPSYIPDKYTLDKERWLLYGKAYEYIGPSGSYLNIEISLPNQQTNLNTERAVLEDVTFRNEPAFFILHRDGNNIFVCVIDGYPTYISGRLSKEELIKIAEGIRPQK